MPLENHVYSYSQLSSFNECPYAFYLQRIEGVDELASNGFAERGTLIHDLLDRWARKELTKPQMLTEYERRYPEEVVTAFPRMLAAKGYTEKAYAQGIDFLTNFDEFEGFNILSTEEKFRIDLPMKDGTARPFVGIIDMMLQDKKTKELIICDHKSKSLSAFKKKEDEMYKQQLIYCAYVKDKYNAFPDRLMFHLFNEEGKKMERYFTKDQYEETLSWAQDSIEKIESYTTIDWLSCKEKSDFYCWYLCGVRHECPNGVETFKSKRRDDNYEED